jgi:pSer/pThr/pTyr-binding forkhead associated (FHA) protein
MILKWPKLLVHSDTGHAEEHAVVGAETVLGRGSDCSIVVEGKKVSAKHAKIALGPTGHLIRDLGSQVGTLVNGVEVSERELANGDTIQLGEVKMTFTV